MDPYLEEPNVWHGFQLSLLVEFGKELNRQLPRQFGALIFEEDWTDRFGKRAGYIRVNPIGKPMEAITIIELIGPRQKVPGPERDSFMKRHEEPATLQVNWVTIDLTRSGERLPLRSPLISPASDYYVSDFAVAVTQAFVGFTDVYDFSVRDSLPSIPVPLHENLPGITGLFTRDDVRLDLQKCFDAVYDKGRYSEWIAYNKLPYPPLREPDATWARELLAARSQPETQP
jgi:hypothetical protein